MPREKARKQVLAQSRKTNRPQNSSSCNAGFFSRDGFRVNEPLCFSGTAGLFAFYTGEATDLQKTANIGTSGIEKGCSFLSREPAGTALWHPNIPPSLAGEARFTLAVALHCWQWKSLRRPKARTTHFD